MAGMATDWNITTKTPEQLPKLVDESGYGVVCLICGGNESLEKPSVGMFSLLIKTGTISSGVDTSQSNICSPCSSSVTLMEQAARVQAILREKSQLRPLNGMNGIKKTSVTSQLIKPGHEVNMPGDVAGRWQLSQIDDPLQLSICDVKGSVDLLDSDDGNNNPLTPVSFDSDDMVMPRMECEVYTHSGLTDLFECTTPENDVDCAEFPPPTQISDVVSRWLPSTSNMSERSFDSSFTDSTISSGCKDRHQSSWKCPMCEMTFESSPVLVTHVHSAHSESEVGTAMCCPFCTKTFPTYTQLDDHITRLHGDGSHSCQGCYSVFLRPSLLRSHKQYCNQYKKYKEEQKPSASTDSDSDKAELSCPHCLIELSDPKCCSRHVEECRASCISKKYNCDGCLAGHDLLKSLFAHQDECELFSDLRSLGSNSDYIIELRCQGCGALDSDYATFQSHKEGCSKIKKLLERESASGNRLHKSSDGDTDLTPSSSSAGTSRPDDPPWCVNGSFVCSQCEISYKDEADLEVHIQSVHMNTDRCPLKCNGCQGGFMSIKSLENHRQRCKHLGPNTNSYPCPECFTPFEFKSLLDFHMVIHQTPELKPYRCFGCKAGFTANTHKVSHEQKCGKCKMKLADGSRNQITNNEVTQSLEDRVDEKDGTAKGKALSRFCCKLCSKEFSYFCDLERHKCTQKKRGKIDDESACVNSSQQDADQRRYIAELVKNIDYQAAKVACPVCHIDVKKGEDSQNISGLKRKIGRHMAGHEKGHYKRMPCPGCQWGSPFPGRAIFLKHANHCLVLREKFPAVEFDNTQVRCPVCLIQYGSIAKCNQHFTDHHLNSLKKHKFSCEGCKAHYTSQAELVCHTSQCLLYPRALSAAGIGIACGVCCVRYSKTEKCDSHIAEYHTILLNAVHCVFCAAKFKTLHNVIFHINTDCPLAQSIFACPDSLPANEKVLIASEVDNQDDQLAVSNDCSEKDGDVFLEKDNQTSKKSKNSDACEICGALGFHGIRAVKHMRIHDEKELRPFRCKACDGGFTSSNVLAAHEPGCIRRNHSATKDVSCVEVASSSVSTSNTNVPTGVLENSTDVPTNVEIDVSKENDCVLLTCNMCDESFESDLQLAEHVMALHEKALHQCGTCQKTFDYVETLLEHQLYCNMETLQNRGRTGGDEDEIEEWKCLSCCIKYTHELSFLLHIASHEVTTVSRCALCSAAFKSAADICMHMVKYHKTYLMTGIKEGGQDDSDKDSDDDSDIEIKSIASKSSQVVASKSVSQVTERSPRSTPRARTPLRSSSTPSIDKADMVAYTRDDYAKPTIAVFKHDLLVGTQCLVCNRNFETNAMLKRHYSIHDGYHTAVCLVCGIGFHKTHLLRKHKARVHRTPKASEVTCDRCSGAFANSWLMSKHREVCICPKNDSVLQCLFCVRTFDTLQQLKSHSWTHLTKCSYCDDKFTVQSRRVDHMIVCAKNPLITGKAQGSQTRASVTKAISSPPPPRVLNKRGPKPKAKKPIEKKKYKCKDCCSEYTTMKSLKRHEVVHEQAEYRCRVCGGKFSSLLAKNKHILREHETQTKLIKAAPKPLEPKLEPIEEKQSILFMCTFCTTCFDSTRERDQHVKEQHDRRQAFDCRHCDKRFGSKFARRRHLQTAHSSQSSQPPSLVCHLCAKRFPSNFAKSQHMKRIHKLTDSELAPPKKPKVCKVCGESFERKSELKAHKRSVHQQNVVINDSIDLAADMLRIGGDKPGELVFSPPKVRACKHCDMKFAHKAELKAHCKAAHAQISSQPSFTELPQEVQLIGNNSLGIPVDFPVDILVNPEGGEKSKPRVCKDCGKTFPTKTELKTHRKAEHKERKLSHLRVDGETLQLLQGMEPTASVKHSLSTTINFATDSEMNGPQRKRIKLQSTESNTSAPAADAANLPHRCEHCSKSFKLRISLNQHLTRAHPWLP